MLHMRTIEEIRHARLMLLLARDEFPTVQAFADRVGKSHAQISQWKNKSKRSTGGFATIDSSSARAIEEALKIETGWMDNDPDLMTLAEAQALIAAAGTMPPAPGPRFADRMEVSESDWGTLSDVKLVLLDEELAMIRKRAEHFRKQGDAATDRIARTSTTNEGKE